MRNHATRRTVASAPARAALVVAPLLLWLSACGDGASLPTVGCTSAADCESRVCVGGQCVDPDQEGDAPAPFEDAATDAPLDTVIQDDVLDASDAEPSDASDVRDATGDPDTTTVDAGTDAADAPDVSDVADAPDTDELDGDVGDTADADTDETDAVSDGSSEPTFELVASVVSDRWATGEPALGYGGTANGIVDVGEAFGLEFVIENTSDAAFVIASVELEVVTGGLRVLEASGVIDDASVEAGAVARVTGLTLDAIDATAGTDVGLELVVTLDGYPAMRHPLRLRPRDARLVFDGLGTIGRTSGIAENPRPGEDYNVPVSLRNVGADAIAPDSVEGNAAEPPLGERTLRWEAASDSLVALIVGAGGDVEGAIPPEGAEEFVDGVVFVVSPTAEDGDEICLELSAEARIGGDAVYRYARTWCTAVGFGTEAFCLDPDGDGFGVGPTCLGPDCNEDRDDVNPAAAEVCDGVDNDCDGFVDNTGLFWFLDGDGDGWGNNAAIVPDCPPDAGWVNRGGDCNDASNAVYPGAPEPCDGIDNDCDLTVDNGVLFDTDRNNCGTCGNVCPTFNNCVAGGCTGFCLDVDGDGYFGVGACARAGEDCNDGNNTINPAAVDTCGNGVDENCDGLDAICPRACDYIAQDCGAGAKCAFDGARGFICVRNGTAAIDSPCTFAAGVDTCAASGICLEWDIPGVDTCHELCRDDTHCANIEEICALTLSGTDDAPIADACVDARRCNPITQDCSPEDRCDSWQDPRLAQTSFRCLTNGSIPRGGNCTGAVGACERGNACVGSDGAFFCRPFCTLPSGTGCPGGFGCASITGWPSSVGACVPL